MSNKSSSTLCIGVLALQGAFKEHCKHIEKLGHLALEVRSSKQLNQIDGLIIPGGESTTMGKLLNDFDMMKPLKCKIRNGLPVWGTCAGLILLAKNIHEDPTVHLGNMDITAVRNTYGRQLGSFKTRLSISNAVNDYPAVFIRAPKIINPTDTVEVLSTLDGDIVSAKQENIFVTAFHPELTEDSRVHAYFIDKFVTGKQ